jgi:hypothetical protein
VVRAETLPPDMEPSSAPPNAMPRTASGFTP